MTELVAAGPEAWKPGVEAIFEGLADGSLVQHIGGRYPLDEVQRAHREMEQGRHIGKLVLVP